MLFSQLITLCWLIFLLYWLVSAIGVKKTIKRNHWWQGSLFRIIILIAFLQVFNLHAFQYFAAYSKITPSNPITSVIGVILCAGGIFFAIWARTHLGKNWGMPMSRKENPELVTSGPYRLVRHPIYTGILLAMLGTLLTSDILWVAPLIFIFIYFIYSAKMEEKLMLRQFPNEYAIYRKKTKNAYSLPPLAS